MLKLIIKGADKQYKTIEVGKFREVEQIFHESSIAGTPYRYNMKEAMQEDFLIKVISETDVGNSLLKLFRDSDTLYDVYQTEVGLSHVREEIKDEVEQNILNNKYRTTDELFSDIREMTISLAPEKVSFFCPLTAEMESAEYDNCGELEYVGENTLVYYEEEIKDAIAKYQDPELNMAEYVGDHAEIKDKLIFAEWTVEERNGKLYGKIDCYLSKILTDEELNRLKDAINGQNSDGLGEGFEQHPIDVEGGKLYVSYWNSGDYFLQTEEEMEEIEPTIKMR